MWSNPLSKNAQQSNRRRKKRNELKNRIDLQKQNKKKGTKRKRDDQLGDEKHKTNGRK